MRDFSAITRWLKEGEAPVLKLLSLMQHTPREQAEILLSGIAGAGDTLGSRTLFGLAELISRSLDAEEAGGLLKWYSDRLRERLPAEDQNLLQVDAIPADTAEAVGRFLFAQMSDIDTRVRWRAAHALRCLARLNSLPAMAQTVAQLDRQRDDVFRDPTAPFYFLAARLWLAIALYRISAEAPAALRLCKEALLNLALGQSLPHVAAREYAKRAILELGASQEGLFTAAELKKVSAVNKAAKGSVTKPDASYRSFDRSGKRDTRFKFDEMDTLPHWYRDLLRIFPTVSPDKVLKMAERWILDVWGADPEANWWDKEPRKSRYDERRYGLWSHRQGDLPTVEPYGTYLEWHAMLCVAGELLKTHPTVEPEYEDSYGSLAYWLSRFLPTEPPHWLFDIRVPTPLEPRLWRQDKKSDASWLKSANREDFLSEVVGEPADDDWITIDAYCDARFPTRDETVKVSSALVTPATALSLVRALQTADNPWDFAIPAEDSNHEIDASSYKLEGWISHPDGDLRFDDNDPFRYDVSRIRSKPGQDVLRVLELEQALCRPTAWNLQNSQEPAFIYEAWSDEPAPQEDYHDRNARSDGHRLRIRKEILKSFLATRKLNLIVEVSIDRRLRKEYSRSYDPDAKRKAHEKIFLVTADGSIEDSKGRIGTWQASGSGTRSRTEHGYARAMDGASHRRADNAGGVSQRPKRKARS